MAEAPMEETPSGLIPAGEGWFVVNVADAFWRTQERFGSSVRFEAPDEIFPEMGFNVRVLMPGQSSGLYHRESNQEAVLVLSGECLLIVEEQERPLRAWDFVHLPPGTEHIVVGAGEGPCVVVMASSRDPGVALMYPRSEVALRHGAGATRETSEAREAYAGNEPPRMARPEVPGLPWA